MHSHRIRFTAALPGEPHGLSLRPSHPIAKMLYVAG
jgi:hypothetical protein